MSTLQISYVQSNQPVEFCFISTVKTNELISKVEVINEEDGNKFKMSFVTGFSIGWPPAMSVSDRNNMHG